MLIKTVAVLPGVSGQPQDEVQFAFHFSKGLTSDHPTAADASLCNGFMAHFLVDSVAGFIAGSGTTHSVSETLGNTVDRANCRIESFDARAGGSVLAIDTPPGGMGAALQANDMPREAALCLSFRGDYTGVAEEIPGGAPGPAGDTHPRARRRGRAFIGPFCAVAAGPNGYPATPIVTTIQLAASSMAGVVQAAAGDWRWVTYSKTSDTVYDVTYAYVDNEWDTQRRRGLHSSYRSIVTVPVWS